jgi:hypothetical protein
MFYFRLIVISLWAHSFMAMFAFCEDSREPDSQVWKVGQHRWTIQEEYNYSKWIETNITEDFFIRHEIRVDCADVPYALRWIYARMNHLPAAANTVNNRLIGHWSMDWKHLPTDENWEKDRRFRAALLYMIYSTSTRTLPSDTYPISISADSMTAGTTFLIAGDHAVIVSHVVKDGSTAHPVQTFEANLPTRFQRLLLRNFSFLDPSQDHVSGFLKFCWPIKTGDRWHYLAMKEHPFYSEEQYSSVFTKGYSGYFEAIEKRIAPKIYDPDEKTEKIINTLTNRLNERIPIVLEGNNKCHKMRCPEGSLLRELYSTPDRDEYIGALIHHLDEIIRINHLDREAFLDKLAKIQLQISPDRFITLQYVFQNSKWISSDPQATVESRWGLDKCGMIANRLKNAQESIFFIQKKYGKTDPHFAKRSIGTQQMTVDELTGESQENNCMMNSNQSNS